MAEGKLAIMEIWGVDAYEFIYGRPSVLQSALMGLCTLLGNFWAVNWLAAMGTLVYMLVEGNFVFFCTPLQNYTCFIELLTIIEIPVACVAVSFCVSEDVLEF